MNKREVKAEQKTLESFSKLIKIAKDKLTTDKKDLKNPETGGTGADNSADEEER